MFTLSSSQMKINSYCLALFIIIFFLQGCKDKHIAVSELFLEYVKNADYDKAKSLLNNGVERTFGAEGLDFRLKRAHEMLEHCGIPTKDKWKIVYDTAREKGIFRMVTI